MPLSFVIENFGGKIRVDLILGTLSVENSFITAYNNVVVTMLKKRKRKYFE